MERRGDRGAGGRFRPGQSGNPFGRPRRRQLWGERLARSLALEAFRDQPEVPLHEHLWAARALIASVPGRRLRTGLGRRNWRDRNQRPPPAWLLGPPPGWPSLAGDLPDEPDSADDPDAGDQTDVDI